MSEGLQETLQAKTTAVQLTVPGAVITRTGAWLWVEASEQTRAHKEELKAAGFRWAHNKKRWYFAGKPASNKRSMDWGYITEKYGEEDLSV